MAWLVEDFLHIAHFDDFPSVHHIHIIRHLRDDAKVVRDVNDGQVHFLLNLFDEVENFALDCHVQCGGGFVADKNVRFGGERNGDNDALPHTAGKLVRIVAEALFGIGDAHQFQQLRGFRARFVLRHVLMQQHALHNLLADGHRGIKARHRVLEYHREALTVVFRAQLLLLNFSKSTVLSCPCPSSYVYRISPLLMVALLSSKPTAAFIVTDFPNRIRPRWRRFRPFANPD